MKEKNKSSPKWKSLSRIILKGNNTKMTDFKNLKMKKPLNQTVKKAIIAVTLSAIIGAPIYIIHYNINKTKRILESYSKIEKVTLSKGENFWNYAKKYRPNDVDVRDYLQYVYDLNNKKSKIDQPGDTLNFPVYSAKKEIKKQK
jgi:hypothetical protein